MTPLVITMHIRSFDARQTLKLDLQIFGNIVTISERLVRVEDDVDFNDYAWAAVPSAHGVERDDVLGMCHRCKTC